MFSGVSLHFGPENGPAVGAVAADRAVSAGTKPGTVRFRSVRAACGILIDAAEGRDFVMHARIAMLRAVNHGLPPPEQPPRRKAVKAFRIIR
jgi:hypothetical protein